MNQTNFLPTPDPAPVHTSVARPTGWALRYLQARQLVWARSRGLELVGSADDGARGFQSYTRTLVENCPFHDQNDIRDFNRGQGNEIQSGKTRCVWSSSALCLNVWGSFRTNPSLVLRLLGLPGQATEFAFERTFPCVAASVTAPNPDLFLFTDQGLVVIESKFSEPYQNRHTSDPLQAKYLNLRDVWAHRPGLRSLAESPSTFGYFDDRQIIKHHLGCTATGARYILVYVYQDVPGLEGCLHRAEIERFMSVCASEVPFQAISYQEILLRMAKLVPGKSTDYLLERYL